MVTLYRDEQVNTISYNLNISKTVVRQVITSYAKYLEDKIMGGEPVKFLNICHIRVNSCISDTQETLAYIATELSRKINQSDVLVKRVLETYENLIVEDLSKGFSYNIRGLVNLTVEGNHVYSKKSSKYQGYDVRVMLIGRFKRKVERRCVPC